VRRFRAASIALLLAVLLVSVATLSAQRQRRGRGFGFALRTPTADSFDGGFNFCRVMFSQSGDGDGGNWGVDYPRADTNLSIRLSELTRTRISRDPKTGDPNHLVMRLTEDAIYECPFLMMTEVGSVYFSPEEAQHLRAYLAKGGFLWVDDFWGGYAWEIWTREFEKVLPSSEFPMVDLPLTHPLFRTQFEVKKIPQIPSINYWYGSGGDTSERGTDSTPPHVRGISDSHGRLMVLITHNTDFGDAFEREGDDPRYFYTFSVDGYAFGINVLLYSLTH
jgi:hypothetical protein